MTVEEIYKEIAHHMVNGMMFHDEMANYYDFLGLKGYKRCHEYHFIEETCNYRKICRYYINHHNKLIPEAEHDYVSVIPSTWYMHTRDDVDEGTKKSAVKTGMTKWVEWERKTKQKYEQAYTHLLELGEIASACRVHECICDVDCELKKAERYLLNCEALGYDMVWVISEQEHLHNKYKEKTPVKL